MKGAINIITKNIRKLCKELGITISQLEKVCGLGKNVFYRWDTHSPSIESVIKVADFFMVSVDELCNTEIRTDKETIEFSKAFYRMNEQQRSLVKVYLSLLPSKREAS